MNKFFKTAALATAVLGFNLAASAQVNKYTNSAYNAIQDGTVSSILLAKDDIDKAMTYPGAAENSHMWVVRSMVYSRIYMKKGDELIVPISKDAGYIAGDAMVKFWKSPVQKKIDIEDAEAETYSSFIACYNESFQTFADKDYVKSIDYYRFCLYLYDKLDTASSNALERQEVTKKTIGDKLALSAYYCSDSKLKLDVLQTMFNDGTNTPLVIEALSKSYLESGDTAKAETVIRDGIKRAPGDNAIFQLLINYFISIDKVEKLFDDLNKQIELNPDSRLYYSRAVLYEQRKDYEKAEADYLKAIEKDEFNYDANNNLGRLLLMYNRDLLLKKKMDSVGEARKKVDAEIKDLYRQAAKYLEMAAENTNYSIDELISIHTTLKNVALELGNQSDADAHEAKVAALKATKAAGN